MNHLIKWVVHILKYDETNNIALDISGYVILRNDMILYNGLSLNNTLLQLQSQYDLISISGLLNSILYLNGFFAFEKIGLI